MAITIKLNPNPTQQQAFVIPNASPFNDGIMTKEQAALLVQLADPPNPGWAASPTSPNGFELGGLEVLSGGRIISVSGWTGFAITNPQVLSFNTSTKSWHILPSISPRGGNVNGILVPATIVTADGRLFVTGGQTTTGVFPSFVAASPITQIFNGVWTTVSPNPFPAFGCSLVLLSDGRILQYGGYNAIDYVEDPFRTGLIQVMIPNAKTLIYNPTNKTIDGQAPNTWVVRTNSNFTRAELDKPLAMQVLQDGRLFTCAGADNWPSFFGTFTPQTATGEIYNPTSRVISGQAPNTWIKTDLLPQIQGEDYVTVPATVDANGNPITFSDLDVLSPGNRDTAQLMLLPDGKVLIAGGYIDYLMPGNFFSTAPTIITGNTIAVTAFDPMTGLATITGLVDLDTTTPQGGTADFGTWFRITGAANPSNNGTFNIRNIISASSCQIYNPNAVVGDANNGAIHWQQFTVILGSRSSCLLFNPNAPPGSQYTQISSLNQARADFGMARQLGGSILAFGGYDTLMRSTATSELFDPITHQWTISDNITPIVAGIDLDGTALATIQMYGMIVKTFNGRIVFGETSANNNPDPNNQVYILTPS